MFGSKSQILKTTKQTISLHNYIYIYCGKCNAEYKNRIHSMLTYCLY